MKENTYKFASEFKKNKKKRLKYSFNYEDM